MMEPSQPAWHKENLQTRLPHLRIRQKMMKVMRTWFEDQGFDEVETPCLQVSPCVEVHMRAFKTILEPMKWGQKGQERWLHTSPEFAMKKLLVGGMEKIFQFAHVFRNGETTERHQPEFTLLEWYRAHASYEQLMNDCAALLRCAGACGHSMTVQWQGVECVLDAPLERITVAEAFDRYCGIDLLSVLPEETESFAAKAKEKGFRVADDDRWEDIFFRLMLDYIEPNLGKGRPTVLCEYPLSQAILSRPKAADGRVAERFELYVSGLELANGFGELTDAGLQRARFEADMDLRQQLYGERFPIDGDFLKALETGMPASSGIAMGVDRLAMLITGAQHISDVLWLPVI